MEKKQRFFIYNRKEVGVLLLLGCVVAIFAFTLGVHLGKRVVPASVTAVVEDTAPVAETVPDSVPNRQELNEQSKGAQQAADESLNQSLHEEVAKTGIKLDVQRQVDLPQKARSESGGSTTLPKTAQASPSSVPSPAPIHVGLPEKAAESEKKVAAQDLLKSLPAAIRQSPSGKFTLQVGSFPGVEDARDVVESLEALGLKPFLRPAEVKGKGRYYRVYLGGYNNKEMAENAGERYRDQHVIETFVVSKMVD